MDDSHDRESRRHDRADDGVQEDNAKMLERLVHHKADLNRGPAMTRPR